MSTKRVQPPSALDAKTLLIIGLITAAPHSQWLFFDIFIQMTDFFIHYRWSSQFYDSLSSGIAFPSWEATSRGSYGDPVFVFYPPIFYYLTSFINFAIANTWVSIKLTIFLSLLFVNIIAWSLMRRFEIPSKLGWLIIVTISFLPMLLVIRGVTNSYPWYLGGAFTILVCFWFHQMMRDSTGKFFASGWLPFAFMLGVIGLTHTLSFLIFAMIFSIAIGVELLWRRFDKDFLRLISLLLICLVVSILIAGYSIFPIALDNDMISPRQYLSTYGATWERGFGIPIFTKGFSLSISFIGPSSAIAGTIVALFIAWHVRPLRSPERIFIIMAAVSVFLSTEASYFLWRNVEVIQFVQRPFRFSVIGTISAIAAIVAMCERLELRSEKTQRVALYSVGCLALFFMVSVGLLTARWAYDPFVRGDRVAANDAIREELYYTAEHLPRTANDGWLDYYKSGGLSGFCERNALECQEMFLTPEHRIWTIASASTTDAVLPMMGFSAWKVTVNGEPTPLQIDPGSGLISASLPEGESTVEVVWEPLFSQSIGRWSTGAAIVLTIVVFALGSRRRSL